MGHRLPAAATLLAAPLLRPGAFAALLAVALAIPATAAAQATPTPATTGGEATPTSATPSPPAGESSSPALARIRRRLDTETPLRDAAEQPEAPTFRTSVTEHVDIWRFWGEPDEVAAFVRPNGGTWHHEFQDMVTPDEFKGLGPGMGNGERLQLAATSLAFAGAMKLLGIGIQQMKQAARSRDVRKAKEEVQRELEAFYVLHPEARPVTPP